MSFEGEGGHEDVSVGTGRIAVVGALPAGAVSVTTSDGDMEGGRLPPPTAP